MRSTMAKKQVYFTSYYKSNKENFVTGCLIEACPLLLVLDSKIQINCKALSFS